MPERTLPEDSSLDSIWSEVVFTEARLTSDANAKEYAPHFRICEDVWSRYAVVRYRSVSAPHFDSVPARRQLEATAVTADDFLAINRDDVGGVARLGL